MCSVPPERHDLGEVFSKQHALSLPPHIPYECTTDLLPGTPLPTSRLYTSERCDGKIYSQVIGSWVNSSILFPIGAGVFFVEKKDHTLRLCIDYRGLKDTTVKNKYLLLLIDSDFEPLNSATVLTRLDLRNTYLRIRIR